jgi:hypothetical protein
MFSDDGGEDEFQFVGFLDECIAFACQIGRIADIDEGEPQAALFGFFAAIFDAQQKIFGLTASLASM